LAATAVNATINPATTNTVKLGTFSTPLKWSEVATHKLYTADVIGNDADNLRITADTGRFAFRHQSQAGVADGVTSVELRLHDKDAVLFTGIKPVNTLAGNWTMTLPPDNGDPGEFLQIDGSGITTWEPVTGFATTELDNLTTTAMNADMNPDANNTRDIGAPGFSWNDLRLFNLKDTNDTSAFAVFDRQLFDSGGDTVIEFSDNTTGVSIGLGAGGVVVPLNLRDADASTFVSLKSPDVLATTYAITLPPDDGTSGQFLQTDGSGVLTWAAATPSFPLLASPTGTAAAPAYSFSGDSDVGMYSDSLNTLSFSTGSSLKWQINSSGYWIPGANITYQIGTTSRVVDAIYNKINIVHNGTTELAAITRFSGASTIGGESFVAEDFRITSTDKPTAIFTGAAATTQKLVLTSGNASAGDSGNLYLSTGSATGSRGSIISNAHIVTSGTDPTITANCGTAPSVVGDDVNGRITVGTGGTATSCTLTFAQAWATAPSCVSNV
jgi:hypothetical protein